MDTALYAVVVLLWFTAAYELRAVIRRPTPMVVGYWFAVLFIALAITLRSSWISAGIDQMAGVPHVSRLGSNWSGVLALFAAQYAAYTGLISPRRRTDLRLLAAVLAGVTLVALTVLFVRAHPLQPEREAWRAYDVNGMAVYRMIALGYMATSFTALASIWARQAFVGNAGSPRIAFGLIAAAALTGLAYAVNGFGIVLDALDRNPVRWWGDQELTNPLVGSAVLLMLLGSMTHVRSRLADALRKHRAFLRLRPLWSIVAAACPDMIVLPKRPLWRDLLDVRDADFRLRRQVTDIEDAAPMLWEPGHPQAPSVARGVAADMGLQDAGRQALVEATILWTAVHRRQGPTSTNGHRRNGRRPPAVAPTSISAPWAGVEDLWTEVEQLAAIAHHLRGSPALRRTLDALAGPTVSTNLGAHEQGTRNA